MLYYYVFSDFREKKVVSETLMSRRQEQQIEAFCEPREQFTLLPIVFF